MSRQASNGSSRIAATTRGRLPKRAPRWARPGRDAHPGDVRQPAGHPLACATCSPQRTASRQSRTSRDAARPAATMASRTGSTGPASARGQRHRSDPERSGAHRHAGAACGRGRAASPAPLMPFLLRALARNTAAACPPWRRWRQAMTDPGSTARVRQASARARLRTRCRNGDTGFRSFRDRTNGSVALGWRQAGRTRKRSNPGGDIANRPGLGRRRDGKRIAGGRSSCGTPASWGTSLRVVC